MLWPHVLLRPHLEEAYRGRQAPPITGAPADAEGMAVLDLMAQGHSNAEIAGTLVTSVSTVRKHLEKILARIGVHSPQRGRGTDDAAGCHRPGPFEAGTASDLVRSTKR